MAALSRQTVSFGASARCRYRDTCLTPENQLWGDSRVTRPRRHSRVARGCCRARKARQPGLRASSSVQPLSRYFFSVTFLSVATGLPPFGVKIERMTTFTAFLCFFSVFLPAVVGRTFTVPAPGPANVRLPEAIRPF